MPLCSLVCATRFKYYDSDGQAPPVKCPLCGEYDSLKHFLECRKVGAPSREVEEVVEFTRRLALGLEVGSPGRPEPVWPATGAEILLGWVGTSSGEISL